MPTHPAPKLPYRADIDGIRAIAVMLVVVFHFHLVSGVNSGFMGVDLFFVISGFLITSIVQRQLQTQSFDLKVFWVHRIRRLAPALVFTTVLSLIAGWFLLLPADFSKLATQTIAAQLYAANIFFWRNVNYFGLHAQDMFLLHTWSLAVEEQFYIVFPIVLMAVFKWTGGLKAWGTTGAAALQSANKRKTTLVLTLLAFASFALNLVFVNIKPEATFYLMPTRAWELLAGALLGLYAAQLQAKPNAPDQSSTAGLTSGLAGLACLAVTLLTYREEIAFPGVFALLPVAAGVLLILSGSLGPNLISKGLSLRVFTYIGKISYPLYLVHWPINVFASGALGTDYSWGWRLAMLLLSVALAALIYHGVEGPARRWLERAGGLRVMGWYGAALVGAVGVSGWLIWTGGAPTRYPPQVAELALRVQDRPPPMHECEYSVKLFGQKSLKTSNLCRLGSSAVAPRWFIYGDSHAWAASKALDQWLQKTGQSAFFMFMHACPPVRGVHVFQQTGTICFASNAAALTYLAEQPSLTHVLLVSTWRQAQNGVLMREPKQQLSVPESIALFEKQLVSTLAELHDMNKNVYVWEPVPGARESVPQAMANSVLKGTPLAINFSRVAYENEFAFFFDALNKRKHPIAGTFSPSKELCTSGDCAYQINGNPLYFDNDHLAYSQSPFWAEALTRQMPGAPAVPAAAASSSVK
jgi:peptidoglycan/LPS O-acetylase OafA/YrhL